MSRKELIRARLDLKQTRDSLSERRQLIKDAVPEILLPSVSFHTRIACRATRLDRAALHSKKRLAISGEQAKSLFNIKNTVIPYIFDRTPSKYETETWSLGPRNAVIEMFEPNDVLAQLDGLLSYCQENGADRQIVSDINIRTLNYVNKRNK